VLARPRVRVSPRLRARKLLQPAGHGRLGMADLCDLAHAGVMFIRMPIKSYYFQHAVLAWPPRLFVDNTIFLFLQFQRLSSTREEGCTIRSNALSQLFHQMFCLRSIFPFAHAFTVFTY
jgi:hypothetical protein